MLDDNLLYSTHAESKNYPCVVIKNFSKSHESKYVMSNLLKEERIVSLDLVNDHKHVCVISELQSNYRISLLNIHTKEIDASDSIYFQVKGLVIPYSNDKCMLLYTDN